MMTQQEWHMATLVVYCHPERMKAVTVAIEDLPEAEVPVAGEQGKLVVMLEGPEQHHLKYHIDHIAALDGVVSVTLICQEPVVFKAGEGIIVAP